MTAPGPRHVLGIDVGSTTAKVVAVDLATDAVVWCDYQRHESRPAEKLLEQLTRLEDEAGLGPGRCRAFITGSGGTSFADVIGARYVQEVAAAALAVEKRHRDARAVVELGGHDAKILVFEEEEDGRMRKSVSMNDKCAGGTGAVIDKIAAKLKMSAGTLTGGPYVGVKIYPIAGKCGVFAETDINSLQKRGVGAEELMASLFEAIVLQNLAVLSRGHTLRPRVLLLGGPHAFIRGLREAWQAHIPRLWQEREVALPPGETVESLIVAPPMAEYFGALGAAEFGRQEQDQTCEYLGGARLGSEVSRARQGTARRGAPAVGVTGLALDAFRERYQQPPWTPPAFAAGLRVRTFVGLDAGSTSTKAVMLGEDGKVLAKAYQLSRGNPIEDAIEMFRLLRQQVEAGGATAEVLGLVTTGYAKDILKEVFAGDAALVETVAHAQSALQLYADPHVIVDVGGQDIKIIVLRDGRVKDFRLNTQCSAGNGYFLQAIAQNFGIPVEQFAEAAFSAKQMPLFTYGCVLFLQSEIANIQRHGWRPEEILAGLAAVLPKNVFLYVAKTPNLARLGTRFVLQGGTQRNLSAVKAQVDFIRESFRDQGREPEIVLHEHCGEAGAIGAALEAIRMWRAGHQTTFVGLDAADHVTFETRCDEQTRCHFCKNECARTIVEIEIGRPSAVGSPRPGAEAPPAAAEGADVAHRRFISASCEKGAAGDLGEMKAVKAAIDAVKKTTPNLVAFAGREVWKPRHPEKVSDPLPSRGWNARTRARVALMQNRERVRIGIPRVFNMYAYAPVFTGYLESLGVPAPNIVFSDFTSNEMYRTGASRGAIDPCFPSKSALAHVHNLMFVKHKRAPLACVFFPMVEVIPSKLRGTLASNACPTVALTPQTVRAAFTKEGDLFAEQGLRYLDPLLDLEDRALFRRQMFQTWEPILGVSWEENERAIEAGFGALAEYDGVIRKAAREALDLVERENRLGIVLLGRVYHHDPGLNHEIPEELQKLGYVVFSQSTLPMDADILERLFGDEVEAGTIADPLDISDVWKNSLAASSNLKLWAAKFAARHPNLVAVELSNFKCGHDAPIFSTIEEIVEMSGTPYFGFKDIDENRPVGAIKLRLETIDYSLKRSHEALREKQARRERLERWLADYERRLREQIAAGATGLPEEPSELPS